MTDSLMVLRADFARMQTTLEGQGRAIQRQGDRLDSHITECAGLNGEVKSELGGMRRGLALHTKVMLGVGGFIGVTLIGLTGTLITALLRKGGLL